MIYYKFLRRDGFDRYFDVKWSLPKRCNFGRWVYDKNGLCVLTKNQILCNSMDETLWVCEAPEGTETILKDKTVVQRARLIKKVSRWSEGMARLFACACAERVLFVYKKYYPSDSRLRKVIKTARQFVYGMATKKELDEAWDMAMHAVRDSDWIPASEAARAAAFTASVGVDLAWYAAKHAAEAVAVFSIKDGNNVYDNAETRSAARAEERKWQRDALLKMIGLYSVEAV